jgi:hypothetical protein
MIYMSVTLQEFDLIMNALGQVKDSALSRTIHVGDERYEVVSWQTDPNPSKTLKKKLETEYADQVEIEEWSYDAY